jgi:serine/threonine-protein kinase
VLAARYRIVAPLGQGGMGEVYRAEDLALGQAVALKFLPERLAADPDRLARFRNEVKVARQVSHPNVCHVYDIGEVGGQFFLTMEYIDGEDLATLLRRIGRLPEDKGVELARQLCLGLAAAHDNGVLHRDLKPHNVMIDGRGQVRLTDFGLAGNAEEFQGAEVRAGTPAYQAPEQRAGKEVTVQSDLYALGLVLYELFTGKRAFLARSREELARLHAEATPSKPSSHVTGLDPVVERVILRCLEKEPRDRPKSALAVAAALPGGDPLAAALAAGETPSPEMVANAGAEGSLHPSIAVTLLASIVLGLTGIAWLSDLVLRRSGQPLKERRPEVLADTAQRLVERLVYREAPKDSAHGLDQGPGQVAPIYFWYRQSLQELRPIGQVVLVDDWPGVVNPSRPPLVVPGMVTVFLDLRGRLLEFQAVPVPGNPDREATAEPDWSLLFKEAGLDRGQFHETKELSWFPVLPSDRHVGWQERDPERPDSPLLVEAGACRGRSSSRFSGPTPRASQAGWTARRSG